MNAVLALIVLFTGSYKNMLFMVVIVCNTVIGIVQEVRSKRITDKLSIIAGSKAHVLRDGAETELPLDGLVRDDVVVLRRGDQVPADAQVVSGDCRVNESLLTGEADLVRKQLGDTLMSGSFVNSGMVYARVVHVGAENYAVKISTEAKERKAVRSEIMRCLNGIIKFVSCIMFPLDALRAIACADDDPNETSRAIIAYFKEAEELPEMCLRMIPFSSDKKWSGAQLSDGSCYVMGAAQFVLGDAYEDVRLQVERLAADARLLLIARVQGFDEQGAFRATLGR